MCSWEREREPPLLPELRATAVPPLLDFAPPLFVPALPVAFLAIVFSWCAWF
jgi:hypothetical protein